MQLWTHGTGQRCLLFPRSCSILPFFAVQITSWWWWETRFNIPIPKRRDQHWSADHMCNGACAPGVLDVTPPSTTALLYVRGQVQENEFLDWSMYFWLIESFGAKHVEEGIGSFIPLLYIASKWLAIKLPNDNTIYIENIVIGICFATLKGTRWFQFS